MRIFFCTDHDIHWPIGGASVVIAETVEKAQELLDEALIKTDLKPYKESEYTLWEISSELECAYILRDGEY